MLAVGVLMGRRRRPAGPWAEVGEEHKRLRLMAGYSQRELAALARVSHSQLSDVENGQVRPSREHCEKVAVPLGVSPATLLAHAGYSAPVPPANGERRRGMVAQLRDQLMGQGVPVEDIALAEGVVRLVLRRAGHPEADASDGHAAGE